MALVTSEKHTPEYVKANAHPSKSVEIEHLITKENKKRDLIVIREANTHMENINLGLMKRELVDLELANDLMLSVQFVNKKALINVFAEKYDLKKGEEERIMTEDGMDISHLFTKFGAGSDDLQYKIDIYKADYIYRTAMYPDENLRQMLDKEKQRMKDLNKTEQGASRELDIYLQYKQGITNKSILDNAILSELTTYYDESLEPVKQTIIEEIDVENTENKGGKTLATGELAIAKDNVKVSRAKYEVIKAGLPWAREFGKGNNLPNDYPRLSTPKGEYKWTKEEDASKKFPGIKGVKMIKTDRTDKNTRIVVPSGARLEVITNFYVKKDPNKIDLDGDKNVLLRNALIRGNKHHLTEITGFATYNKYEGKASGKVDFDSAPDNVDLMKIGFNNSTFAANKKQDFSCIEDDTDAAPRIVVDIAPEDAPRRAKGIIWEEHKSNQAARVNQGDGIYKDEEKGIPNKIIVMKEKIAIKGEDITNKYREEKGLGKKVGFNPNENYVEVEYIWDNTIVDHDNTDVIYIGDLRKATGYQSYIRTIGEKGKQHKLSSGKSIDLKQGEYIFEGVPAGNFVLELPYVIQGNDSTQTLGVLNKGDIEITPVVERDKRIKKSPTVYNGQDFKTTLFNQNEDGTPATDADINMSWMPLKPKKRASYGRDRELQRFVLYNRARVINAPLGNALSVLDKSVDGEAQDQLNDENKKYINELANMIAETPHINFGVEYYGGVPKANNLYEKFDMIFAIDGVTKVNQKVVKGVRDDVEKIYPDINIGLIERPRTKMVLDKEIARLQIMSSDGNKIIDAKYNTKYTVDKETRDSLVSVPEFDQARLKDKNFENVKTGYGYETPEYILRKEIEVDKDSLKGDAVKPVATKIYATATPAYWNLKKNEDGSYPNARGWENVYKKDMYERNSNGYVYINFDKQILSDSNITIDYDLVVFNLGEVDRTTLKVDPKTITEEQIQNDDYLATHIGRYAKNKEKYSKLNHEYNAKDFGFGRLFGEPYYTGIYKKDNNGFIDKVGKSYANVVIDYIDNSATKTEDLEETWLEVRNVDELKKYVLINGQPVKDKEQLHDPDQKSYFNSTGSNIFLTRKMSKGLVPFYEYKAETGKTGESVLNTKIGASRLASQQADDLSFDNICEIVEYETDTARRTPSSTPGNIVTTSQDTFEGKNLEPDTGLATLVTITPPTGLSKQEKLTISIANILLMTVPVLIVIVLGVKIAIDKKAKKTTSKK